MAKRRILHEIQLDKIAAVDLPCQEHATMVIMKRAGATGDPADQGAPMPATIKKALGLSETATDAEVEAAVTKALTDSAAATAEAARLAKYVTMSPEHRAHYDELAKADKAKAKDFMDMEEDKREASCAKARADDETLVVAGQTISKRNIGDAAFTVLKAQQAQLDENTAALAKAREDTENATIAKRVETEFAHIAGTVQERTLVLKALSKVDDATRAAAEKVLKAAEAASKFAFEKAGARDGSVDEGSPAGQLAKMVKARQTEKSLSYEKAYAEVIRENPHLYEG